MLPANEDVDVDDLVRASPGRREEIARGDPKKSVEEDCGLSDCCIDHWLGRHKAAARFAYIRVYGEAQCLSGGLEFVAASRMTAVGFECVQRSGVDDMSSSLFST